MASIFKAYDIRGLYGETLTDSMAHAIGRAFATFTKCRKVAVGRDVRPHSEPLFKALAEGLCRQGAAVVDLGHCSTPMCYFGNGFLDCDAGIMITASHNPGEWNGFKLARAQAQPISGDTGIREIERIVQTQAFDAPADSPATVTAFDIQSAYSKHVHRFSKLTQRPRIAADMANGMGIFEARAIESLVDLDPLFNEPDGSFPNHEANPLKRETLTELQARVRQGRYAFGIAFDGDADRVGFVDETGAVVPMDLITALIASDILSTTRGVIFYDLRSSRAVAEAIEQAGGTAMKSRVGHAFIKQQMRDHDALFAGELSGHYYFKENYFAESAALAVLCVANILDRDGGTLSERIAPLQRYAATGEINSEVDDPEAVLARIRERFPDARRETLDGLSLYFDRWWFNVRGSNTEPLIRLNLEAETPALMREKRDALLALIRA